MSESILTNRNGIIVEKGTWTPVATKILSFHTAPTYTVTESNAVYYRIGKLCYISCWYSINITNAGNSSICIEGIPYMSVDATTSRSQVFAGNCMSVTSGTRYGTVRLVDNYNKVVVLKHDYEDNQPYTTGTLLISFSGFYVINSSYY